MLSVWTRELEDCLLAGEGHSLGTGLSLPRRPALQRSCVWLHGAVLPPSTLTAGPAPREQREQGLHRPRIPRGLARGQDSLPRAARGLGSRCPRWNLDMSPGLALTSQGPAPGSIPAQRLWPEDQALSWPLSPCRWGSHRTFLSHHASCGWCQQERPAGFPGAPGDHTPPSSHHCPRAGRPHCDLRPSGRIVQSCWQVGKSAQSTQEAMDCLGPH